MDVRAEPCLIQCHHKLRKTLWDHQLIVCLLVFQAIPKGISESRAVAAFAFLQFRANTSPIAKRFQTACVSRQNSPAHSKTKQTPLECRKEIRAVVQSVGSTDSVRPIKNRPIIPRPFSQHARPPLESTHLRLKLAFGMSGSSLKTIPATQPPFLLFHPVLSLGPETLLF